MVAGDEGEGLLRQAHEGAPGGGDQGREAVRAGCVLPSWRDRKRERERESRMKTRCKDGGMMM